jgi:Serine dehydrogenase proteinase
MPTWNDIDREIRSIPDPNGCDAVRTKYIAELEHKVGRTVIAYYSGFLQKRNPNGTIHPECAISDLDMNGFMATIHNVPRNRGLDLVIHTPGGGIEAARALVEYLYKMFSNDIRVIVPHMAMSAGTMIACASKQILMGKHSCLGPTDPQVKGLPAMGILQEVERAIVEIRAEPLKQFVYQQVFSKYPPALIIDCERAVDGARIMVKGWLECNMFRHHAEPAKMAEAVVGCLMDYAATTEHSHHFMVDKCIEMGLDVMPLESDQDLQESVLSVHHAFVASFALTDAIKIIQNSAGAIWTPQIAH